MESSGIPPVSIKIQPGKFGVQRIPARKMEVIPPKFKDSKVKRPKKLGMGIIFFIGSGGGIYWEKEFPIFSSPISLDNHGVKMWKLRNLKEFPIFSRPLKTGKDPWDTSGMDPSLYSLIPELFQAHSRNWNHRSRPKIWDEGAVYPGGKKPKTPG